MSAEEIPVEEDSQLTRMPNLAIPFAIFGAVAGLFAILCVASFRPAAQEVSPLMVTIMTALIGGGTGYLFRNWDQLYNPLLARDAIILRVAGLTIGAAALAGGTIGLMTWGFDGFPRFFLGGGMFGLLFVPACLVIVESAHRAGRGRLGSLVAATDLRTVHSTILAGVAFAATTEVVAILNNDFAPSIDGVTQIGIALTTSLASTVTIFVLMRKDRASRAALQKAADEAQWLDRVDQDSESTTTQQEQALDLGVGGDNWSRVNDQGYRMSARSDVVLKGSIDEAMTAFGEAERRRHRSLSVAAASLVAILCAFLTRIDVIDW